MLLACAQDAQSADALVAKLKVMKKEECAAEVVALAAKSVDDAAVVIPNLKPGFARAALGALTPDVVGLVLAAMDADEIATSLSAMVRVGAARIW